jgi:hypothetical protein
VGTKKQQFSLENVFLTPGVLLGAVTFVATTTDCLLQDPGLYSENKEQRPVHHFVKRLTRPFKTHMSMMAL